MPAGKRPRSPEPSESGSDDESDPATPPLGDGGSDDDSQDTQHVDPDDPIAVATDKAKRGEWQEGDALPKNVYKNKISKKKYHLQAKRGGKQQNFRDDDPNVLYRKLEEWHADLDAQGVPPTRKRAPPKRAEKQSGVDGVTWHPKARNWRGIVTDRVESAKQGRTVQVRARWFDKSKGKSGEFSTQFDDQTACEQATIALRARLDTEFKTWLADKVAADPLVAGLSCGPADKKDWKEGVVYWVASQKDRWKPIRMAKFGNTCHRACHECNQKALGDGKGGEATHCKRHGGGPRCPGFGGVECQHGMSVRTGNKDIYDGMCVRCFCAAKPNDPRAALARSYLHAREQAVVKRLKKLFPNLTWRFDKTVAAVAGRMHLVGVRRRFRPDAMTVVEERVLIVEIDENSHRAYFCYKEREREASFAAQFPSKKVVMIRFNPDAYTDYNGVRHPTCFSEPTKENSQVRLNPDQKDQWEERIKVLARTIRYVINSDNELPPKQEDRPILMIELFYDNVMATDEDKRVKKEAHKFNAIGRRRRAAAKAAKLRK